MAIYHLEAKVISRSNGRSAVAAAAYRAGEKLFDSRLDKYHDYSTKKDVYQSEILLPSSAPSGFANRESLWNTVEFSERRADSQLAREVVISLPRELTPDQNWLLAKDFVQKTFVDEGMIADLNVHLGHFGQQDQPHAHVMLTMRNVNEDGFELKNRSWNQTGVLEQWRSDWADFCNQRLLELGHTVRIDHRSLEAQGLDLEPQKKIGPKHASYHSDRFDDHQDIARRNGEKLLKSPSLVLEAMTYHHSTFTMTEIKQLIGRHTADAEQFSAVYAKVEFLPELVQIPYTDRFTTRSQLKLETDLQRDALALQKRCTHGVDPDFIHENQGLSKFTEGQLSALLHLVEPNNLSLLVGHPGTGKSFILEQAVEEWRLAGYRVKGLSFTGKIAEDMHRALRVPCHTVASACQAWEQGRHTLSEKNIVVVDEAGMLGARQLGEIIRHVNAADAKLVLVGDSAQLQPIESGAAFRMLCENFEHTRLAHIVRQQVDWQRHASELFAQSHTGDALVQYCFYKHVHGHNTKEKSFIDLVNHWNGDRQTSPSSSQLMIAYTRHDVRVLNDLARQIKVTEGSLDEGLPFQVSREQRNIDGFEHLSTRERRTIHMATGDKFMFLQNEYQSLNVKNGTMGDVLSVKSDEISVRIDGVGDEPPRTVTFSPSQYRHFDHAYAVSVYKSQGCTVDKSYVYISPHFDRNSMNVAATRHRQDVQFFHAFKDQNHLMHEVCKARGKDITADYLTAGDAMSLIKQESSLLQRLGDCFSELGRKSPTIKFLHDRTHQRAVRQLAVKLSDETQLHIDTSYREGDTGLYQDTVMLDGRRYGLLVSEENHAKLLPGNLIDGFQKDQYLEISRDIPGDSRSPLKAIIPCRLDTMTLDLLESKSGAIEQVIGLTFSTDIKPGDHGVWCSEITVNDKLFSVIKTEDSHAKLVPSEWMSDDCQHHESVHFEREFIDNGRQEKLMAHSGSEREMTRDDRHLEYEFEMGSIF